MKLIKPRFKQVVLLSRDCTLSEIYIAVTGRLIANVKLHFFIINVEIPIQN